MPVHMCGSMANLDALIKICRSHNLILIEDACQAIGGSYNGKALGTLGDLGCFSFDFVKTVTCGEGGVVITNNNDLYTNADLYSDHGHDHLGIDRGADTHPYLGYNFRISELNAAVGLAQFRRLDDFINIQKKHYTIIRNELENLNGLTFRTVPKGGEESYAFLNFFLDDLDTARKVNSAFKSNGIDVCFHYYDNNWHYIRNWGHLKSQNSLIPLSKELKNGLSYLKKKSFEKSDHFIGRNISCLIKLSWKESEVVKRAKVMASIISSITS
jgi:8-amino-3,8-dideoxy-alpha-D-manno-octulosonate transaminase